MMIERDRSRAEAAADRASSAVAIADEQAMLDKSVDAVKGLVTACKGIDQSLA